MFAKLAAEQRCSVNRLANRLAPRLCVFFFLMIFVKGVFIVWVVAPGEPLWTFQIISVTEGGRPVHARRARGDTRGLGGFSAADRVSLGKEQSIYTGAVQH